MGDAGCGGEKRACNAMAARRGLWRAEQGPPPGAMTQTLGPAAGYDDSDIIATTAARRTLRRCHAATDGQAKGNGSARLDPLTSITGILLPRLLKLESRRRLPNRIRALTFRRVPTRALPPSSVIGTNYVGNAARACAILTRASGWAMTPLASLALTMAGGSLPGSVQGMHNAKGKLR